MAELHPYEVIRRPLVTEKAVLMSEELEQYVFEVHHKANKIQIKDAVEVIFDKPVAKVRTMVMPAKRGRRGRRWYMRTSKWKKAIVTLADGETLELYNV